MRFFVFLWGLTWALQDIQEVVQFSGGGLQEARLHIETEVVVGQGAVEVQEDGVLEGHEFFNLVGFEVVFEVDFDQLHL